jgi:hypothetical protein
MSPLDVNLLTGIVESDHVLFVLDRLGLRRRPTVPLPLTQPLCHRFDGVAAVSFDLHCRVALVNGRLNRSVGCVELCSLVGLWSTQFLTHVMWTPLSPIDTHTGTSTDSSVVEAAAVAVDSRSGVRSGSRAACPRVGGRGG